MSQPKISVLVPCYNVERFLRQCLDSVIGQTLRDMEIIVINDGSTDSTLKIIQEYAANDARIRIIDKPNEGYGKSMNRGLDMATGEYIGIVESDDWVDANMFETLVGIADKHNVDAVRSNFYCYTTTSGTDKNVLVKNVPSGDSDRVINPRHDTGVFYGSPSIWSSIYRRDFLQKNNIRFLESAGASYQDTAFNFKVWAMASRAYLTDDAYLHYRTDNENSSVKSGGKIFCVCDEWAEIERYLAERGLLSAFSKLIPTVKIWTYLWNYGRLNNAARDQFLTRFGAEFRRHIKYREFSRARYDDKSWCRLMRTIYPKSQWWRFQKHFWDVVRPIYKTRIRDGYKTYYLFDKLVIKRVKIPKIEVC